MKWLNILVVALIGMVFLSSRLPAFAEPVSEGENIANGPIKNNNECIRKVETIADPSQSYNRAIYKFNDKAYFYFLRPVARGYKAVLPEKARVSVRNLFSNTGMPVRFLNCVLQLKLRDSAIELTRFVINSTWGVGGLFNPAKSCLHLKKHDEDFGQTLGFYGLKEGFFINWPLLGPSSLRDSIGAFVDCLSDPLFYVDPVLRTKVGTVDKINKTSLSLGSYEELKRSSVDPYLALRNNYFQHRRHLIEE